MRGTRVHSIAEHAGRRAYSAGFWFVACGFATVMSFGTVPTPLYVLYQARDHLSATTVTVVFAAYAVGVLLSLFLLGHFSDVLGRRRVLLPAVYVAVVADLCFLFWSSLPDRGESGRSRPGPGRRRCARGSRAPSAATALLDLSGPAAGDGRADEPGS